VERRLRNIENALLTNSATKPPRNDHPSETEAAQGAGRTVNNGGNGGSGFRIQGLAASMGLEEFKIRGIAGPRKTTVIAQNFRQGTTAMDIEMVMEDIAQVQARVLSAMPNVVVEIVFPSHETAEECVRKYNGNQVSSSVSHMPVIT
jgi:hypothetical protein